MLPPMSRTLWLVVVAMTMFAAGLVVFIAAKDLGEHVLAGVAMLGALAIVVANVGTNGKTERRDYNHERGDTPHDYRRRRHR